MSLFGEKNFFVKIVKKKRKETIDEIFISEGSGSWTGGQGSSHISIDIDYFLWKEIREQKKGSFMYRNGISRDLFFFRFLSMNVVGGI